MSYERWPEYDDAYDFSPPCCECIKREKDVDSAIRHMQGVLNQICGEQPLDIDQLYDDLYWVCKGLDMNGMDVKPNISRPVKLALHKNLTKLALAK